MPYERLYHSLDATQVEPILIRESGAIPDAAVAYKELQAFKNQVLTWFQQQNQGYPRGSMATEQVLGRYVTTEASKGGTIIIRHIEEVIRYTSDHIVVLMQPSGE